MYNYFIGIDISKFFFDASVEVKGKIKHRQFSNAQVGFDAFMRWCQALKLNNVHVCMEATGAFWFELAQFLYDNLNAVSVVNPVCIKRFAQSELKRTKTDKVDAGIIARFCQKMSPSLWLPAAAEVQALQKLVRRLHDLTKMRQQERNRLSSKSLDEYTSKSVERMLAHLDSEISRIKKQIERLYKHHPQLQEKRKLLMTIPGVGTETANVVLTEVPHLELFGSAKQLAAFAGLAPREFRSGSSIRGRTRMSKTGRSRLRQCLYLPSVTARSCNPIIQVFCSRLLKNGKAPMKVVGAAMRKMLHIIFGVLKSGKPFDERIAWA